MKGQGRRACRWNARKGVTRCLSEQALIDKKMIARVEKEDKDGNKKVVVPPVDLDL